MNPPPHHATGGKHHETKRPPASVRAGPPPPSLPQLAGTLAGAALKGGLLVGLMYLLYVALWERPKIFAWFWKLFE